MNGKIQKQKSIADVKDLQKAKKVLGEPEAEPVAAVAAHTELDPEVVEALNAKKVKKTKPPHEVDYIPELERDDSNIE